MGVITSALAVAELLPLRPALHWHVDSIGDVGLRDVALVLHHAAEAVEVGYGAHLHTALWRGVGPLGDGAHALAQLADAALRLHVPCQRQHQQCTHHHSHRFRHPHLAQTRTNLKPAGEDYAQDYDQSLMLNLT